MKFAIVTMLCCMLISLSASTVHADWIFNEIRTVVKNKVFGPQREALKKKHKGRILSGEGYVFDIRKSTQMNAVEVHLMEEKEFDEQPIVGDVSVVIPASSPDYKKAKKFKPGQKVSFSGRMDDLFGKTIFVKGSVKITAK